MLPYIQIFPRLPSEHAQLALRSPFRPSHRRFRFASFSVFRFGEAVSTDQRQNPQEEKVQTVAFFSYFLVPAQNLGVTGKITTT